MYFKTANGKKLAKITSNNDERIWSDLKAINDNGEELIIFNRYSPNHKAFDSDSRNSDGFKYIDCSQYMELSGSSLHYSQDF